MRMMIGMKCTSPRRRLRFTRLAWRSRGRLRRTGRLRRRFAPQRKHFYSHIIAWRVNVQTLDWGAFRRI